MPRIPPQNLEFNQFVAGLITEATPLNFPENASLDEVNFVLDRDGSRQRRLGMDYEDSYTKISIGEDLTTSSDAIGSFTWDTVNSRGDLNFTVVQVGDQLYFFDASSSSMSANPINGGNTVALQGSTSEKASVASLYGRLVVVHGTQDILILEYDEDSDTIAVSTERLKCRDLWGVEQNAAIDERQDISTQPFLELAKRYNLRNEGWAEEISSYREVSGNSRGDEDPIEQYQTNHSEWPANTDLFVLGQIETASTPEKIGSYSSYLARKTMEGIIEPPRGRYIIDPFARGESRDNEASLTGFTFEDKLGSIVTGGFAANGWKDITYGGLSSIAAYAGRVFYTVKVTGEEETDGNSPNLGTMVFYSQVGNSVKSIAKCHAANDPTGKDFSDPLDTDGGFVTIPEAGEIFGLAPMGNSMYVIASNGVWEIHGGDGSSFSATNQSLAKTSSTGAVNIGSIIVAEGAIAYWSRGGIEIITLDPATGRGSAQNISQGTIQSLYDAISEDSRASVVGEYDLTRKQLKWLYRSSTLANSNFYNRELVFDSNLNAFSVQEIQPLVSNSPYVAGYVKLQSAIYNTVEELIFAGTDQVFVDSSPVVNNVRQISSDEQTTIKYLTFVPDGAGNWSFTFSSYNDETWHDWKSEDGTGVDAAAYVTTGHLTGGNSSLYKSATYLMVYLKRTEDGFSPDASGGYEPTNSSSCMVQSQWQWTNHTNAGRWGRAFQAYRLPRHYVPDDVGDDWSEYGFTVVKTRNKLRGKGSALSIKFSTEEGKDCHIYGWGLLLSGNAMP